MFRALKALLRNAAATISEHRRLDHLLPHILKEAGCVIDRSRMDERSRFAVAPAKFNRDSWGWISYGLSGFSLVRNGTMARVELFVSDDGESGKELLYQAGRAMYPTRRFPAPESKIHLDGGPTVRVIEVTRVEGPSASGLNCPFYIVQIDRDRPNRSRRSRK
jgi:hypothetical protein